MNKIRILFYTDHPQIIGTPSPVIWSLADLKQFVTFKTKGAADVEITFINRHRDTQTGEQIHGANKLVWDFVSKYDELWIFGSEKKDLPDPDPALSKPYNELDAYEVSVLRKWMQTGGLMLTGDHSEPDPTDPNSKCDGDHQSFLNRGRALGYRIPRAGQLRVWQGPPTNCEDNGDNFNTHECPDANPCDLNDINLGYDAKPQTLIDLPAMPHPLFSYVDQSGQVVSIRVFPDHLHEGKVRALKQEELNDEWPTGSPLPVVVARGLDKRPFPEPKKYDLVVAFDGDPVNVGRIVADSSFHHYLSVNLAKLKSRDPTDGNPVPGTDLDQIAQYYANLALWLAPKIIRDQLKSELFFRLATNPDVLEASGTGIVNLGKAAQYALKSQVGLANFYHILAPSGSSGIERLLSLALSEETADDESTGGLEIILGSIVQEHHDFFAANRLYSPGWLEENPAPPDTIEKGFIRALQSQPGLIENFSAQFREATEVFLGSNNAFSILREAIRPEEDDMFKCKGDWFSWINLSPSSLPNDGFFTVNDPDPATGAFTGMHHHPHGDFNIMGNCKQPTPENPGQPHHIEFQRVEGGCTYTYSGDIINIGGTDMAFGKRHKDCGLDAVMDTGDDDWIGQKTT